MVVTLISLLLSELKIDKYTYVHVEHTIATFEHLKQCSVINLNENSAK